MCQGTPKQGCTCSVWPGCGETRPMGGRGMFSIRH
nr:MAG TPA: hypothetical protein [Caudoviricetes sp.]